MIGFGSQNKFLSVNRLLILLLIFNSCDLLVDTGFDSDFDGIADIYDECPTIQGTKELNGCPDIEVSSICYGDNGCWVRLYTDFEMDENGYYKIPFEDNGGFSRFNVHIESSAVKQDCQYNGVSVISSSFDSNTFYEIESGISFTMPLYSPFNSLFSQSGNPIKIKDTIVTLDYFQGTIQEVVQSTRVYHDVKDKQECFGWSEPYSGPTPSVTGDCIMYSKRIVGPIPNLFKGDTIKIFSRTNFDCGNRSKYLKDSLSVIII